jgi:UDP-N-acetylglucosamine--N-acetylmuramyl-(pentapeptide) pyrophosphoryl-undecaprenol N-acetylglucosamine transferase
MVSATGPDRSRRALRVLLAGGGTLGHLMPGVAVAEELRLRWPESELMLVCPCGGAAGDYLRRLLASKGIRLANVSALKWQGGGWLGSCLALRGLPALAGGFLSAISLVRRFAPDVVLGLGGYGSVPTVLAAALLGVPTILLEQNARPGKANRLLARWARAVCCAWSGAEAFLPRSVRVCVTGNPVRRDVWGGAAARDAAGKTPSRERGQKTLLIMGGSSGAVAINQMMVASLPYLAPHRSWLRIVHSTGPSSGQAVLDAYRSHGLDALVTPLITDMACAYRMCDLVVCRAGGTSLAELCAAGKPAVLIPFPYAAEDHQRANAMRLVQAGAVVVLDQFQTTPQRLSETVLNLLADEARLREMAARSRALGRPEAGRAVVREIERCLGRWDGMAHRRRSVSSCFCVGQAVCHGAATSDALGRIS